MSGMNAGINISDPTVVAAFRAALAHQAIAAVLLFILLALAWVSVREFRGVRLADGSATDGLAEAPARKVLRIAFGLLWILDGVLQAQPGMVVGLPSGVIRPAAQSSPAWVQHLVNWAGTDWSYHPIQAAAGAVWIQAGIGIWLLLASRGRLSRLAGLAGAAWGLSVWIFGEAFGGIFAPGLSWLTGAPGAAGWYAVAGLLVALPASAWRSARTGRLITGGLGVFLVGMAVLQAWPGRGYWQGQHNGRPGSLTSMVQQMAAVPQPRALHDLVAAFGSLARAHGFAVNLVAVIALGAIGTAFVSAAARGAAPRTRHRAVLRIALAALAVLGFADWVLVQDLGIFGGLGTDPNSMIPIATLATAGFLALVPQRQAVAQAAHSEIGIEPALLRPAGHGPFPPSRGSWLSWREWLRPGRLSGALAAASPATVASAGAIGVILLGAVPMAAAQTSSAASPILAEAVDGSSAPLNSPAPGFTLTDQHGRPVSLASLRGKVILLTFLDPVCVTDCPLIAQEFRQAGQLLAAQSGRVELVAIDVNPLYRDVSYLRAFDQQERLTTLPNWLYLTGTASQLIPVWRGYGVAAQTLPAGAMLGHSDTAFVIGRDGRLRLELNFDPGPGTAATISSFGTELADAARHALAGS